MCPSITSVEVIVDRLGVPGRVHEMMQVAGVASGVHSINLAVV